MKVILSSFRRGSISCSLMSGPSLVHSLYNMFFHLHRVSSFSHIKPPTPFLQRSLSITQNQSPPPVRETPTSRPPAPRIQNMSHPSPKTAAPRAQHANFCTSQPAGKVRGQRTAGATRRGRRTPGKTRLSYGSGLKFGARGTRGAVWLSRSLGGARGTFNYTRRRAGGRARSRIMQIRQIFRP